MQKKESFSGYDNLNTDRKIALTQADFVSQAKPLLTWWVIAFKGMQWEGIIFIIIIILLLLS